MIQQNIRFTLYPRYRLIGMVLLFFFVTSAQSYGQDSPIHNDFQVWLFTKVSKNLNKKWSAGIQLADRFENNARFQKSMFVEPILGYQITNNLETSLAYRFSYDPLDKEEASRITTRTSYSMRFKPYDVSFRIRTDSELATSDVIDNLRTRIGLKYKRKKHKLSPGASFEHFLSSKKNGWQGSKWRSRLGLQYRMNKRHQFTLFYLIQREYNTTRPDQVFVLGAGYKYSIRKRKKDKDSI